MEYKHKTGAVLVLPVDITHGQLEVYETTAINILDKAERKTNAALSRAAISGAIKAGFIADSAGCPKSIEEIEGFSARVLWWMAEKISAYIVDLKTVDPE